MAEILISVSVHVCFLLTKLVGLQAARGSVCVVDMECIQVERTNFSDWGLDHEIQ